MADTICRRLPNLGMGIICWILLGCSSNSAERRTEKLVCMLNNGDNYRVRVSAASALGNIGTTEAKHALVRAVEDENDLVAISAATALAQIGDRSAIKYLENAYRKTQSTALKSQIRATIRILTAVTGPGRWVNRSGLS